MTYSLAEAQADRDREERTLELELRCLSCGDVDRREVYEGEADPCTATVDGQECLSTAVERA